MCIFPGDRPETIAKIIGQSLKNRLGKEFDKRRLSYKHEQIPMETDRGRIRESSSESGNCHVFLAKMGRCPKILSTN